MSKFTLKERVDQYQKLALRTNEGNQAREAYAQSLGVPILQEVKTQSSIMSIFTPVELQPNERAEFQVEPSTAPSTNKYTGAPTNPLIVQDVPGMGPSLCQILTSKTVEVVTSPFDSESGFPVSAAERAIFSFEEAHRRRLANAIATNIEGKGWTLVQAIAAHGSFPLTQTVEIAAGNPGQGYFSIQLFNKILRLLLDVGIATEGIFTPTLWISNQSFEDYGNWAINSQFDSSTPAQIPESLKEELSQIAGTVNVGGYRKVPFVGLRRLQTGDITASKDYCYLTLRSEVPNGFVLPIRTVAEQGIISGLEEYFPMKLMNSTTSVYDHNEVRTKVRWECGYAELDVRNLYTGIINRS